MLYTLPGSLIQFWTKEFQLCPDFLGSFTSQLCLETWTEHVTIVIDSEMVLEKPSIEIESE